MGNVNVTQEPPTPLPTYRVGHGGEGTHWYNAKGEACFEVLKADGKGYKKTTVREARRDNLFPGITGCLAMQAAPELNRWLENGLIDAAGENPKDWDEDHKAYRNRIKRIGGAKSHQARSVGTCIHKAGEQVMQGVPSSEIDPEWYEFGHGIVTAMATRFPGATWEAEKSFAHTLGYACTLDAISSDAGIIVDYKGKDDDKVLTATGFSSNIQQLAAQREAAGMPQARCFNLFFSREVPGHIKFVEYSEEQLQHAWEEAKLLVRLKCLTTNHFPTIEKGE